MVIICTEIYKTVNKNIYTIVIYNTIAIGTDKIYKVVKKIYTP